MVRTAFQSGQPHSAVKKLHKQTIRLDEKGERQRDGRGDQKRELSQHEELEEQREERTRRAGPGCSPVHWNRTASMKAHHSFTRCIRDMLGVYCILTTVPHLEDTKISLVS